MLESYPRLKNVGLQLNLYYSDRKSKPYHTCSNLYQWTGKLSLFNGPFIPNQILKQTNKQNKMADRSDK